ncbi:MAG: nitrilase family protein [Ignavibacteria bacterium]|nr:nitrilase family protein [Ignavibacteria bacterium]
MKNEHKLLITIVQYNPQWEKPEENRNKIFTLLERYVKNTDVIILPEMFTTGFTMNVEKCSETMKGETVSWMKKISKECKSAVCGSIIVKEKSRKKKFKYFNRFLWVNTSGRVLYYDKRNLFSLVGEERYFARGTERIIINYKKWKVFPLICYDLRFPVWSRFNRDFDIIIYVANWPARRSYPWKQLLIARAIENQSYVVGVNRVGYDSNNVYHSGDSCLIGPDGSVLFSIADKECVETLEIDKKELDTFREKLPFLKDKKFEFTI